MLYLTCTTITSVDLAHYIVSHAKDWVSVDCGTILVIWSEMQWQAANTPIRLKVKSRQDVHRLQVVFENANYMQILLSRIKEIK